MLKWFREYNKFILVIGGCLLMVAFLVQPVLSMFMPKPADQPLGTLDGVEITLGDQQIAGREITLVRQTHQLIAMITPEEPLQWILMKHEAASMGVSASGYEVTELLTNLGVTEPMLKDMAKVTGSTVYSIKQALRDWLMIQNYKELILGTSHTSPVQKIRAMSQTQQMFQNLLQQVKDQPQMKQMYMQYYYQRLAQIQTGAARVSTPLVEHFISDQQSRVKVGLLQISSDRYLDKVSLETQKKDAAVTVTHAQLQKLFDDYKDNLPGTSKPYGFGYRFPERVKLEYIAIPDDRLMPLVKVNETDAVAFYDENPSYFTEPVPADEKKDDAKDAADKKPATRLKPYIEVRDQIIEHLKQIKAQELGNKIIKTAQTILLGDARKLEVKDGYRVVTDDYKATPLEEVAKDIQKQFGILPDVKVMDKNWLNRDAVSALPGIGSSTVLGKARLGFADYVFSVKEIERETPSVHAGLRLQANVVSMPMSSYDGSRYIFRILDAQAERSPASLDQVRSEVVKDAKSLAAYQLLLKDAASWTRRLSTQSLQTIATAIGGKVDEPAPFQRRQVAMGGAGVPDVQGVGQDEKFVDGVFDFAMKLAGEHPEALKKMGPDKRTTAVPAPTKLSLYMVRVDEVHPVTQKQYDQRLSSTEALEGIGAAIQSTILGRDTTNPFELETISKRVGFVSDMVKDKKDEKKSDAG